MKLVRALVSLVLALGIASASAQSGYPDRQITLVVGFTAGGSTDIVTRLLAEEMRKSWGQPVVVDNRPGAGGNIGAAMVAKARPDGYTLLVGSVGPLAINASLYANMPYDNLKDFTPISLIVHVPNMLVVNPAAMPVHSFAEFVALVRANPGKYFFASTGTGTRRSYAFRRAFMRAMSSAKSMACLGQRLAVSPAGSVCSWLATLTPAHAAAARRNTPRLPPGNCTRHARCRS